MLPAPIQAAPPSPLPKTTAYPVETAACTLGPFTPIAFLPDNYRIMGRVNKGISILDLHTGLEELFLQAGQEVTRAGLSPDGGYLALGLADASIQFYQVTGKRLLYTFTAHTGAVNSLKFSPRGDRLISASEDGWVRMWDLGGKEVFAFQPPLENGAASAQISAALSPDGTRLATKAGGQAIKVWDVQSLAPMLAIQTSIGAFNGADIAFSPDGQSIAWGLGGGPVSLNRVIDGAPIWSGGVYALAFSPDGSLLAYSDADDEGHHRVALRSLAENKTLGVLSEQAGPVWRIIFSPDGSLLAAAADQETTFWQLGGSLAEAASATDSRTGLSLVGRVRLTRRSICP